MTIVADGNENIIDQVGKQLNKQVDVIKVREFSRDEAVRRELALIKVNASAADRGQISDIAAIMKADIIDLSPTTVTIEIADTPERICQMLGLLEPYGICELTRTGMIALMRGSKRL
jgi:acetolactate synthase-1/3 small subunit